MDHAPFKHKRTTLERAEKFISPHYFTDINLRSRLYCEKAALTSIKHYAAKDRISFNEAMKGKFETAAIGQAFGPVWSTHWFELQVTIRPGWADKEVHLLWDSGSEALVWINGEPRQGLSSDNNRISFPLTSKETGGSLEQTVYIEMACNHLFGIGSCAIVKPEDDKKTFTLKQAEISLFDRDVHSLILDVETLHDMAKELPEESQRGYQALYTVNEMINQIDVQDRSTYQRAAEMAQEFFRQKNGESQHTVYAMGHAHIDTAWLWPIAETKRKCARSWTCTLRLMEKYPDFTFMCSQAQQYAWVKELYPSVWQDVCKYVSKGQFVPVGGTWVEMDGNIPSGEACIRQFLYGQQFFQAEFGVTCREFWLPDTFGYSGQFPQIMQHCGVSRFLTQKLSWSLVNKFPHHTFYWEGIDGSSVLAHFPPGDSYEMRGKVSELLKSVHNFKDKGRTNRSAFLFGYGDGGHGPREDMLERLSRLKDCDGLPKVKMATSDDFFSSVEAERPSLLCRWRGELYLELHNGTYTTWAKVKKYNRKCEILLQETEFLCTLAWALSTCRGQRSGVDDPKRGYAYPKDALDTAWKLVLVNQFHDILPGTSINMVFHDAIRNYKEVENSCSGMMDAALRFCQGLLPSEGSPSTELYVINTQPFARLENVYTDEAADLSQPPAKRRRSDQTSGSYKVRIPALSIRRLEECTIPEDSQHTSSIDVTMKDDCYVLATDKLTVTVDPLGRVTSLVCADGGRTSQEAINPDYPANQFLLYDDIPLYWDAWDVMDYHLETRNPVLNAIQRVKIEDGSYRSRATLEVSLKISDQSYLQQKIIVEEGCPYVRFDTEVTWYENRKFLKVEFPTTVHTTEASYDIQSGFVRRPNHFNTSWDSARFEVCGHKWADLSQHGFGVSVLNDCKYGYSAVDGILRLSLLRSPKTPDYKADMGTHTFSYALMPHFGSLQEAGVIQTAEAFNCPLRLAKLPPSPAAVNSSNGKGGDGAATPPQGSGFKAGLFEVDTPQVLVQAVKMAEDGSQTIIVRLNECFGGSVHAHLSSWLRFTQVEVCDGLEAPGGEDREVKVHTEVSQTSGTRVTVDLSAFQIVSLRCTL